MTVKMICGAAFYDDERGRRRVATPDDPPVTLDAKRERKLVDKGMAVYTSTPAPTSTPVIEKVDDETVDYAKMTNPELKAICDEMGIEFSGRPTKAEMIAAIEGEDEAPVFDALDAE